MKIEYPKYLFLLIGLVFIGICFTVIYYLNKRKLENFRNYNKVQTIIDNYFLIYFREKIFLLLGIAFLIIALSNVQWGYRYENKSIVGVDVVLMVDVSNSMLANDIMPTRLDRVKRILSTVFAADSSIRYSLVAFKGSAHLLVPMTFDFSSINNWVQKLDPNIITTPGTNLNEGFAKALSSFSSEIETKRIIFLFCDGVSDSFKLDQNLILSCQKNNIRVIAIGCGTEEGGFIQLDENRVMMDKNLTPFRVKLQPNELKRLAKQTNGNYLELNQPSIVQKLEDEFLSIKEDSHRAEFFVSRINRYNIFLLCAFLLLILAKIPPFVERRGKLK